MTATSAASSISTAASSARSGVEHMKLLESDGQLIKVLDRDGVVALDPSLASAKDRIAGGIHCPTDETGDPAKFTRALAAKVVDAAA